MKKEFKITQEEMDHIDQIDKEYGDPVMFLSGGTPLSRSLVEKMSDYWRELAVKYGFKHMSVSAPGSTNLHFYAEPEDVILPKSVSEHEAEKYDTLERIVEQLEKCEYTTKDGLHDLKMNAAFISLREIAKKDNNEEGN